MTSAIYAIADAEALHPRPLPAAVSEMAEAGVRWIQIRAKRLSGREWYPMLEGCCRALEGSGVELWVDDRADLAALFPVQGLHLGQADLPPRAARRVVVRLEGGIRLGLSTHDEEQLAAAAADPEVAVVAVGPVFPTTGKEWPDPVVGLDFVRRARVLTGKRLVAIGGIDAGNVAAVLAAGADAAAVLGAVCRGDVRANCRRLLAAVGEGPCAST
ncbi:MAG: thiamine-phosphate pyrophosphorylase [Acidobacteriota bacterium]|jgi:thiamine-phosphate pyrophosphorylase|nr:thiamine-phosphate pyrophosphorylase [Acidobacteriota bacterium]